jgi:general stress protein 26
MPVSWSTELDGVLAGDQVVGVASVTPARGVVIAPMTNFAVHDRQAGLVTVNSSVGASKKIERMRRNPHVAIAFHSRDHSTADGQQYVLVQGVATVSAPVPDFPATIGTRWDDKDGAPPRGLWGRWLRVYYTRIPIDIAVERITIWPDLSASGEPEILGTQPPSSAAPQAPPLGGTGARIDCGRAARMARRLPHVLLGWVGEDGLPMVVPVLITGFDDDGIRLGTAGPVLPSAHRRAGLTAHSFSHHGHDDHGNHQRLHTGWLEVDSPHTATYRPHTRAGFRMPPSTSLYRLAVGFSARRGANDHTEASLGASH